VRIDPASGGANHQNDSERIRYLPALFFDYRQRFDSTARIRAVMFFIPAGKPSRTAQVDRNLIKPAAEGLILSANCGANLIALPVLRESNTHFFALTQLSQLEGKGEQNQ
jgi:hypothetical protein